jgi:hypothetical protein
MAVTKNNTTLLKKKVLAALEKSLGVVTPACKAAGISRSKFYKWKKSDKKFRKDVDSVEGIAVDFVETKLFLQIKENNPTSTIFFLKCRAKGRGYLEKDRNTITFDFDPDKSMAENSTNAIADMASGKISPEKCEKILTSISKAVSIEAETETADMVKEIFKELGLDKKD